MTEISKDTLGDRMKRHEAEAVNTDGLKSQSPVVIRLDGNAFHTWTRKMRLERPFDERFVSVMQQTMLFLCEQIPNCVMGYCQSDEISLCLRNDMSEKTEPWFENRIQKLCSISSSMAGAVFNRLVDQTFVKPPAPIKVPLNNISKEQLDELRRELDEELTKLHVDYVMLPWGTTCPAKGELPLAFFDSRVMFMPDLEEVVNCFIWRQNDCVKNSVSALAQAYFSPRQLNGKKSEGMKGMLRDKGVDWDCLPTHLRLGSVCHKREEPGEYNGQAFVRKKFFVDINPPKFSEDKGFLRDAYCF